MAASIFSLSKMLSINLFQEMPCYSMTTSIRSCLWKSSIPKKKKRKKNASFSCEQSCTKASTPWILCKRDFHGFILIQIDALYANNVGKIWILCLWLQINFAFLDPTSNFVRYNHTTLVRSSSAQEQCKITCGLKLKSKKTNIIFNNTVATLWTVWNELNRSTFTDTSNSQFC